MSRAKPKESRLERVSVALRAYSRVNRALIHSTNEQDLLQRVVEILNESGDYGLVWIGVPVDDEACSVRIIAAAGPARDYIQSLPLSWAAGKLGEGPVGRCLRGEGISVSSDFQNDPRCTPWHSLARMYNLHAAVSFPLNFGGSSRAVLTLYRQDKPGFATPELTLLTELAEDISFGVTALRTRKAAELERAARERLEFQLLRATKTETVGRLSGAIAHEFNNLLTIISGQTELLSMDLEGKQLDRALKVKSSVRRATDLTRQLSSFSQQKQQPRTETTLNALLEHLASDLDRLLKNGVLLVHELCEKPWRVRVDRVQMGQLIKLMVNNSIEAMPNGGTVVIGVTNCTLPGDPDIAEGCIPAGRYALLSITDTGNGICPGMKTRLLQSDFTPTPLERGMGLTLTMVHEMARENGGILFVRSTVESGTSFRIYFPIVEGDDAVAPVPARVTELSGLEQVLKQLPSSSAHIN